MKCILENQTNHYCIKFMIVDKWESDKIVLTQILNIIAEQQTLACLYPALWTL